MLEYEYYVIDTAYNAWFLNQIMVGRPDWFWSLPWMRKLEFFASVPPFRVLEGTVTKLLADGLDIMKKRQVEQDPEKLLAEVRSNGPDSSLPEVNIHSGISMKTVMPLSLLVRLRRISIRLIERCWLNTIRGTPYAHSPGILPTGMPIHIWYGLRS
jgi:hypothetical protein